MSQTRIRVPKPPARRRVRLEVSAGVFCLLMLVMYWVVRTQGWLVAATDSTEGTVLDTRIVLDHIAESRTGSQMYYRLEARVSYKDEAQSSSPRQDRWLVASEVTQTHELLVMLQEKKPKACRVYWIPKHPETVKCQLE